MSRCFRVLSVVLLLLSILSMSVPVRAAETNLIANPSAETASGSQPANWTADRWGTNTATLTYATTGHTGSRSLRIDMSAYTDGDAKWMHTAATVTGSTSYTYSSWYMSNVPTEHVLQYTASNGAVSYAYGQAVPASTSWKQTALTFTTPANTTKVVVLHLIAGVGWLQTDDFSLSPTVQAPPPSGGNLIANASFETTNGALPAGWNTGSWGTNTTSFVYETTGRTGSRSATVSTSAYTNGDAKWYAEPVAVTAGKAYTYSDYYKANVATHVVVAYINSSGAYSYADLEDAAVASNWSLYSSTFTIPSGIVKATVYHLLSGAGQLTLDDVNLSTNTTNTSIVPNPSVETGTTAPTSWQTDKWGTNTTAFQYITTGGHTGSKSLKVTVSNYKDGDGKWLFNPVSLQQGKQYRFSFWYKTNAKPKVAARFTLADGTEKYYGMPNPFPAADAATTWHQYSDTFNVPTGAQSVTAFMFIDGNGWVQTDDYSIENYTPTGFNRPLLTLTFDDGHEDNVTNALPLLNQYGFKTTQCFATTYIEGQGQAAENNVLAFFNSGHEICSHSVTHPMMTTLTDAQLDYEAKHSQEYLQGLIGQPVPNFATPYGDYDARVNDVLDNYYGSHRTVDEGFNSKDNFNRYRLRVQNIFNTTTAAEVTAWVNQAKADNTWLILVYHRIGANPEEFDSSPQVFAQHLQAIQASGITVKTYQDALTETSSQL